MIVVILFDIAGLLLLLVDECYYWQINIRLYCIFINLMYDYDEYCLKCAQTSELMTVHTNTL